MPSNRPTCVFGCRVSAFCNDSCEGLPTKNPTECQNLTSQTSSTSRQRQQQYDFNGRLIFVSTTLCLKGIYSLFICLVLHVLLVKSSFPSVVPTDAYRISGACHLVSPGVPPSERYPVFNLRSQRLAALSISQLK